MKLNLILLCSVLAITSQSYATPYDLFGSTSDPAPGVDYFDGSGPMEFTITVDDDNETIKADVTFHANASGSLANFFFMSLTDGPTPGLGDTATLVFDASSGVPIVSAYDYIPFDGSSEPIINVFSGGLLFTSLNGDPEVLSSSISNPSATSVNYQFEIDSSALPPLSFDNFAGIWLQSMGLNPLDGTMITYNGAGLISNLVANIDSPGGYGWYDGEVLQTTPTEVPEPASVLLLGGALGVLAKRKRA